MARSPWSFSIGMPDSETISRSVISMTVDSREKKAVGTPKSTAAFLAIPRARAVVPVPGRPPMTTRSPALQPRVSLSRDG